MRTSLSGASRGRSYRAGKLPLDPVLRHVEVRELGRILMMNAAEPGFQEPAASLVFVLLRELHEDRYEEAIGKNQMAFRVVAACRNLHRLEV